MTTQHQPRLFSVWWLLCASPLVACSVNEPAPPGEGEGESEDGGEGEGEGEGGTEGEGEGPIATATSRLSDVDGDNVEVPLPLLDTLPLAAVNIDGTPQLWCAELVEGVPTLAIVAFALPLSATPTPVLRLDGVLDAEDASGHFALDAVTADLDGDNHTDVVLRFVSGKTVTLQATDGGVDVVDVRTLASSGRGSLAVADHAVLLAGLNGDMYRLTLSDAVNVTTVNQRHEIDGYGYCVTGFATNTTDVLATAAVCARFGDVRGGPPTGPDRLLSLDDDLSLLTSVALATESAGRLLVDGDSVWIGGAGYAASVDQSGGPLVQQTTLPLTDDAAVQGDGALLLLADLDGDGDAQAVVAQAANFAAGTVLSLSPEQTAVVPPVRADVDGDGRDDLVITHWRE